MNRILKAGLLAVTVVGLTAASFTAPAEARHHNYQAEYLNAIAMQTYANQVAQRSYGYGGYGMPYGAYGAYGGGCNRGYNPYNAGYGYNSYGNPYGNIGMLQRVRMGLGF